METLPTENEVVDNWRQTTDVGCWRQIPDMGCSRQTADMASVPNWKQRSNIILL
jgi:hypothetical protein